VGVPVDVLEGVPVAVGVADVVAETVCDAVVVAVWVGDAVVVAVTEGVAVVVGVEVALAVDVADGVCDGTNVGVGDVSQPATFGGMDTPWKCSPRRALRITVGAARDTVSYRYATVAVHAYSAHAAPADSLRPVTEYTGADTLNETASAAA